MPPSIGNAPLPRRFLEKKTYESEFRAVDRRAPPLSQEAYAFIDKLIYEAVVKSLRDRGTFAPTWFEVMFGWYHDKNIPAVRFGKSLKTSANMFVVGRDALKRSFMSVALPDLGTTLTNVRTLHAPHFSSLRIWRALRLLFKTRAETNYATAIVVRFIRLVYKHMLAKGEPYYTGLRVSPGLKAKTKTYASVRFKPLTWVWVLPEDYEISKNDIVQGLRAKGDDPAANFAAVFDSFAEIYSENTRSKDDIFKERLMRLLKNELKVADAKVRNALKKGFKTSVAA